MNTHPWTNVKKTGEERKQRWGDNRGNAYQMI